MLQRAPRLLRRALRRRGSGAAVFQSRKIRNLDWIGESIAESVNDSLASSDLLTLDRGDRLEAYRRLSLRAGAEITHASIIKIGQALDASSVVYGSYELLPGLSTDTVNNPANTQSKGSLRITARILDLKLMRQGAEFGETGALEDLAAIEVRLGWQALKQLTPIPKFPSGNLSRRGRRYVSTRWKTTSAVCWPRRRSRAAASSHRRRALTNITRRHAFNWPRATGKRRSTRLRPAGLSAWRVRIRAIWRRNFSGSVPVLRRRLRGLRAMLRDRGGPGSAERGLQRLGRGAGAPAQIGRGDASFTKALEGVAPTRITASTWASRGGARRNTTTRLPIFAPRWNATQRSGSHLVAGPAPSSTTARAPATLAARNRERVKTNYEEAAYRQLQAELKKYVGQASWPVPARNSGAARDAGTTGQEACRTKITHQPRTPINNRPQVSKLPHKLAPVRSVRAGQIASAVEC